jgi:hypothetical protein
MLLDGQFGDKLTAAYVQPYLRAIRAGQPLDFCQHPASKTGDVFEQQQLQDLQEGAALQDTKAQQLAVGEGTSSNRGDCKVVLLLFDTGGCGRLQLQRLQARGLVRDAGKYAQFEQYRRQEQQKLQLQLELAAEAALLDSVVEVDTTRESSACVEDIVEQLALLRCSE